MIILITGAAHTGKALLAQRLLERYHYPYLSIDAHFDDIVRHGSDIETRLSEDCTVDGLKRNNRMVRDGCQQYSLPVTLIDGDYKQTLQELLDGLL